MVDTEKLERKICESGIKKQALCEGMGITPRSFLQKRKNEMPFKADEVYYLCEQLNIKSMKEMREIFFTGKNNPKKDCVIKC